MSGAWPAWATEPVHVASFDPCWDRAAARLMALVAPALEAVTDQGVHHVGSTAVPGLDAKPTLDLMAGLSALADAPALDRPLANLGWQLVPPELDGRLWRRSYVLPDGDRRRAHLHLVASSDPRFTQTLIFRDCLRTNDALARRYASLKRQLARAHPADREAYTAGKSAFIEDALDAAAT